MTEILLTNVFSETLTVSGFLTATIVALILGVLMAVVYSYKSTYTKSFMVTLAILPAIVSTVIMLVSGSLGAGVAVAGTFSLVRFRSVPGTAKEIGAIFLSMAAGLACGMGYPGFAVLFALIMCLATFVLNATSFGERKGETRRMLTVTMPEDLEYGGVFDDIFAQYTSSARMTNVRTTNLGSLNKITYEVVLKELGREKEMIDEIRKRNGNLEVSLGLQSTLVTEL